jgi:hypothetical protein
MLPRSIQAAPAAVPATAAAGSRRPKRLIDGCCLAVRAFGADTGTDLGQDGRRSRPRKEKQMRWGMMTVGGLLAVLAVLAVGVGSAGAAPRDVYKDWADNGRLDRTYTASELEAALADTTLQGYGDSNFVPTVQEEIGTLQESSPTPLDDTGQPGTLPFTGVDLALLVGGGLLLLIVGAGMRRAARAKT